MVGFLTILGTKLVLDSEVNKGIEVKNSKDVSQELLNKPQIEAVLDTTIFRFKKKVEDTTKLKDFFSIEVVLDSLQRDFSDLFGETLGEFREAAQNRVDPKVAILNYGNGLDSCIHILEKYINILEEQGDTLDLEKLEVKAIRPLKAEEAKQIIDQINTLILSLVQLVSDPSDENKKNFKEEQSRTISLVNEKKNFEDGEEIELPGLDNGTIKIIFSF